MNETWDQYYPPWKRRGRKSELIAIRRFQRIQKVQRLFLFEYFSGNQTSLDRETADILDSLVINSSKGIEKYSSKKKVFIPVSNFFTK